MGPTDTSRRCVAESLEAAFAVDSNDRIVAWNEKAEELLGHDSRALCGRRMAEVLRCRDVFGNRFHGAGLHRMAREGEILQPAELDLPTAAGEYVRVEASFAVVVGPTGDDHHLVYLVRPVRRRRKTDRPSGSMTPVPAATVAAVRAPSPRHRPGQLTRREVEVLRQLSLGRTSRQVAHELGISVSTARNHAQHILEKLGASSRVEAVSIALRHRII